MCIHYIYYLYLYNSQMYIYIYGDIFIFVYLFVFGVRFYIRESAHLLTFRSHADPSSGHHAARHLAALRRRDTKPTVGTSRYVALMVFQAVNATGRNLVCEQNYVRSVAINIYIYIYVYIYIYIFI